MDKIDDQKVNSSDILNVNISDSIKNRIISLNLNSNEAKITLITKILEAEDKLIPSGRIEQKDIKFFSNT